MSLLLVALLLAPPAPPAPAPAPTHHATGFTQLRAELEQATALAIEEPAAARPKLDAALARLENYRARLAGDPEALHARDMAMLALAHTYVQANDQLRAAAAMDDFIRTVADRPFDLRVFGGPVVDLYAARLELLERGGVGSIHAACDACVLFIDEAMVVKPRPRLYLGTYRVWLVSDTQTIASEVTITRDGEVRYVDLPGSGSRPSGPGEPPPPQLVDVAGGFGPDGAGPGQRNRILHPGAEITGVLISLGLTIGGSALLALKQQCLDLPECRADYSIPIGGTLLGVGTAGIAGFATVLIIDEIRAARRRAR